MAVRASADLGRSTALIPSALGVRPVVAVALLVVAAGCARAAPVAIILATSEQESLAHYARIAEHLPGWRVVSLDLPAHGKDQRPGEAQPLVAWRARLDAGENLVREFTVRLSRLIDTLATDRIALVGTSRGGFMALHAWPPIHASTPSLPSCP
jgi:alpha-beta hydrolase superfamily lysophospholipase